MAATLPKPVVKTTEPMKVDNGPSYDELTKYHTHAWDETFLGVTRYS